MTGPRIHHPGEPSYVASCRMPTPGSIALADSERRLAAQTSSQALLAALDRYFRAGGKG